MSVAHDGPLLEIAHVSKRYDAATLALRDVSLRVGEGEIVALVGPSGCGKTTLLRIVAGLETPDSGSVRFEGRDLLPQPVHARGFGLMFQEFALFPDKTVAQNVAFGLRMRGDQGGVTAGKLTSGQIAARVDEMLELVNLRGYGKRTIFQLSGGERQRVALARSLAPSPRLLMLDEPLGSLDRALRETLMEEVRAILKRLGLTALYVTHDQQEALAVADRIAIMNKGEIVQLADPRTIWNAPATVFVARFLGFQNLLPAGGEAVRQYVGAAVEGEAVRQYAGTSVEGAGARIIKTVIGDIAIEEGSGCVAVDSSMGQYTLLIRPDALRMDAGGEGTFRGKIAQVSYRGAFQRVEVAVEGRGGPVVLVFDAPAELPLAVNEVISFDLDASRVSVLPAE